ncbi:DUF167 domain-containing protein [Candidatus Kaiserbacteria bacterium]|nr:DUF167 domain-containing protein [Candidatus Kaiserbacteria bacterium]
MGIKVRVRAGARREKFEVVSKAEFRITVREKALENAANRRVIELIALHFGVPKNRVRLVRGHRSPAKLLDILKL